MDISHLQYIIERYDHYYDSVNNKGQFFLSLNTFILGGIGVAYTLITTKLDDHLGVSLTMLAIAFFSLLSIDFTLYALVPYLGSGKTKENNSIIFFGSVAGMTKEAFLQKVANCTEEGCLQDYANQTYHLACGLQEKFINLRIAGLFIAAQFLLIIPFLYMFYSLLNQE